MLEVVEDEQHAAISDGCCELACRAECTRSSLEDGAGVGNRRQRNPPDAVWISIRYNAGRLQREARFAAPSCARQGQETHVVPREQHIDVVQFPFAPQERRRGYRKVRLVERLQRREVAVAELVDPLRRR